ncbi:outer membrane beta-barrel protein [Hymenobacter rubripertinctus]|uniref:PorT family protein n=1 Tax=Hymenobacter rubripertinctus TaxID=2029981 RepID=A0A418QU41_9BACT|nr:outer membrane beta-barrel protein [Hymenobacter rubripertinctus]RIY08757.1 PorT family protein [Hymenobacter rubripertinctus]
MMLKKLLLPLLLGSASAVEAQTNFRPGYIVMATGDTLRGDINLRGQDLNSRQVELRSAGHQASVYTPADIKAYGVVGRQDWEAFELAGEDTPPTSRYFLERLVRGPASLYRVVTRKGVEKYYLLTPAGKLEQLANTRQTRQQDGVDIYVEGREYQQVLATAFQECLHLQPQITTTPFREKALLDLISTYNTRCMGQLPQRVVRQTQLQLQLEALAGIQRGEVAFSGDVIYAGATFRKITPTWGMGIALTSSRSPTISARLEAYYSHEQYGGTYSTAATPNQEIQVTIDYLRIPLLLRYTLPLDKWQLFSQVGYVANVALSHEGMLRYPFYSGYLERRLIPEANLRKLDSGVQAGIGFSKQVIGMHPVSVALRYDWSTGFIDSEGVQAGMNRWGVTLGYGLRKER